MRPSQLLSVALLSSTISAWSLQDAWADANNKAVQGIEGLFRRQDNNNNDSTSSSSKNANAPTSTMQKASSTAKSTGDSSSDSSATSTDKASSDSDSKTTDGSSGGSSATGKTSGGSSGTAKTTGKTTGKTTSGAKVTATTQTYNASVGYGGLSMVTPNPISSSSYYKVGNYLTFAWNFTSLKVTPTAVDILASCSANAATYTIAMNQTIDGSEGSVTWDTGEYQATATLPLLTETYTLIIHDAAKEASATVDYGHLSAYSAFKFAMYTKQPYTALSENWQCVTCSGAMSLAEKQALGFMFGMAAVTVMSFTWFAGSFGAF